MGLIVAIGTALRLWRLDSLPPGLHVDEAYNLLDALAVLDGWRPVFLPDNAGREVLFTYLQAPLIAGLGPTTWAARGASAVAGLIGILATWLWARQARWPSADPRWVALAAAALMAGLYWPLHFSRFGIRAILFAPIVAIALWTWRAALESPPRPRWSAATVGFGLALGAAVYTHPAGRGLVVVPLVHALWRRWTQADWAAFRILGRGLLVAGVAALPVMLFWIQHPELFTGHAEEVSILDAGPAAVAQNALRVAGMFNVAGDPAPWRNLVHPSPRPVFDVVSGLAFLVGLAALGISAFGLFARHRDEHENAARDDRAAADDAALILIALAVLLLPSVVTDAAPNFSRTTGAMPLAAAAAGLGLVLAAGGVTGWAGRVARGIAPAEPDSTTPGEADSRPVTLAFPAVLVIGVLVLTTAVTARDYFVGYAGAPDTPLAFDADKVLAGSLADHESATLASPFLAAHPSVRVTAGSGPGIPQDEWGVRGFDPGAGVVLPAVPGRYVALEWEEQFQAHLRSWFDEPLDSPPVEQLPTGPAESVAEAIVYLDVPVSPANRPNRDLGLKSAPGVDFGGIRLQGYAAPARAKIGSTMTVTLRWSAEDPAAGLTTFVHLVDAAGETVGFGDDDPIAGTFPTAEWRIGEHVVSRHAMAIDEEARPGTAQVVIGWYRRDSGERIPWRTVGPPESSPDEQRGQGGAPGGQTEASAGQSDGTSGQTEGGAPTAYPLASVRLEEPS